MRRKLPDHRDLRILKGMEESRRNRLHTDGSSHHAAKWDALEEADALKRAVLLVEAHLATGAVH